MQIINPKIELIEQGENIVSHIARCARVCYKREKGNDEVTYNNLLKNKHWSMFRHATFYFIIPRSKVPDWIRYYYTAIQNEANIIGIDIRFDCNYYYVVTNGNWNLDHQCLIDTIIDYKVEDKEFNNYYFTRIMMRYTFKVTTQISTSRELNRVSPNSISEQSTRYVYEDGTICRPHWMTLEEMNYFNNTNYGDISNDISSTKINKYITSCHNSFTNYKELINYGVPREDARGVLPLDTATEVVYTYSWNEWANIIRKRVYHTTGKAHSNCVVVCKMIEKELNKLDYYVQRNNDA